MIKPLPLPTICPFNYPKRLLIACLLTITAFGAAPGAAAAVTVGQLRCEYLPDPLGIDVPQPRLSWVMGADKGTARGQAQKGYQILVAGNRNELEANQGDLWDSGQVDSNQSIQVRYAGKALASGQECFWKVRVWDEQGRPSAWSEPARWTMGLLKPTDWHGRWIGLDEPAASQAAGPENRQLPARMLRREFAVEKKVRRATAYVCGLGLSEFYLNGRKVGDQVLSPGLTDYSKRALYVTFDVTKELKPGMNAAGVMLGNGRFYAPRSQVPTKTMSYGFPKLLFQMRIEYQGGTSAEIVSDNAWSLTTDGPIRANNEYDGEEYDARKEMAGWSAPGFDASQWQPAQGVTAPGGVLAAQMIPPIRVMETLRPITLTQPKPGVWIFDLGQNMVGWCRLKVSGPRGTEVRLRHAETLKPDGTLYLANIRSAKVTDTYTLKGRGTEVYEPRFTYHGFRFVEVTGYPGQPRLSSLEGRVVHDALENAGDFACSNPLLNHIYKNIVWGVRGNYRSIPTDCPQRDERQGWLGDRSAESKGETCLFDTAALYAKWLNDMADAQKDNGSVSDVCPAFWPIYSDNVTWPSSTVIIPDALREQFADAAIVERHYPSAKKWMDYMSGFITNGIIARDSYGDWCVPPEDPKLIHSNDPKRQTDKALLATAYFYYDAKLMACYAAWLGKPEDARHFTELAEMLKAAFNGKFLHADTGQYDNGSQTSCVLPLAFGLVPDRQRERVFDHLVKKITDETHGHVGTGLIGGQWLMRVLTDGGRADLAYTIATQKDYPSWGYMVEKGATTIWELWNGDTADPAMNSGNHVMLVGDLGIWLYENLAGIKSDRGQPGFKLILMRPEPVGDLRFVKASHRSLYGLIASEWQKQDGVFRWKVTIPVNTTAIVYVPAASVESVTESGKPATQARGVKLVEMENGRAVFSVGSGNYSFESRMQ
jgi:alpha-L-rhamnosidase